MSVSIFILTALFVLIARGYAAEKSSHQVQHIGILPYYAPDKIWQLYSPLIKYLNTSTDIKWELKLFHSYDSVIEGICSGEISIAYLGPNPFGLAYEKCRIKPLVVTLGSDEKPFYNSVIITNDFNMNSLQELKGKKFAFGDRDSTSSYIVAKKLLEDEGITMHMINPVFLKGHEKIIQAVLSNQVTAGATKQSVYNKFKILNLKLLKTSGPLPHHTFCISPSANPNIGKKFKDALLKLKPMHNAGDKEIVKNWDPELAYGFAAPYDTYIQDTLKLHNLLKKYKNEN